MKLKFIFFIIFYNFCNAQSDSIKLTPRLELLLNDMKLYKLDSEGETYFHAGDLYEHSIWTYNALLELFKTNSPYVGTIQLTERQKEVVAFAALLHDVGKAGRIDLFNHTHPKLRYDIIKNNLGHVSHIAYYYDYRSHPCVGFEYVGKHLFAQDNNVYKAKDYHLINQETGILTTFNFIEMYNELGLTLDEQKIIAILIGMHYEFGILMNNTITIEEFFNSLKKCIQAVDYNNGSINELILNLALLIGIADVKGMIPVEAQTSPLFPQGIFLEASHAPLKLENPFIAFGYSCDDGSIPPAVIAMNTVLSHFYTNELKNI